MEHVANEELASLVPSSNNELKLSGETEAQMAQRLFRESAVFAAQSICHLAVHCPSDRIKLQAATYVVERVLGRVQDNPPKSDVDPYDALVAECVRYVEIGE